MSIGTSFFLSMDVTFRESKPYYEPTNDTGITLSPPEGQQEGESNNGGSHMGSVLVPSSVGSIFVPPSVGSFGDNLVHS